MVDAKQLHGWTKEDAECMGKPHFGARYLSNDPENLKRYTPDENQCCICGAPANNIHHQPAGRKTFTLATGRGTWVLRPALFRLCGSGTWRCHGDIHAEKIRIRWKWDTPEAEAMWWSGELLAKYGPHAVELYQFGAWDIELENGRHIERRKHLKRGTR